MLWSFTIYWGVVLVEHFDQLEAAGNKEVWNVTPIQLIRWNIVNQSKTFMVKNDFKHRGINGIMWAYKGSIWAFPSRNENEGMLRHMKIVISSCCPWEHCSINALSKGTPAIIQFQNITFLLVCCMNFYRHYINDSEWLLWNCDVGWMNKVVGVDK